MRASAEGSDADIDLSGPRIVDDVDDQACFVSEEAKVKAVELKHKADAAFKVEDYLAAGRLYEEAIELNPLDAKLFCNRALVRIRRGIHEWALSDCTLALILDPTYVKAFYRRGISHLDVGYAKLALQDFEKVLELDPKNMDARRRYKETRNLIQRLKFEKAIKLPERDAVELCREAIAIGECTVDEGYAGPILPLKALSSSTGDEGCSPKERYSMTQDFLVALFKWYNDGNSLPRRYVWEIALGAYEVFRREESLVEVTVEYGETADVVGDVHGQYYDYQHLLSLTGLPSEEHVLLMNGDLVDKGAWSIEVIVTAFALKWMFPKRMFVNRGNHEDETANRLYGFKDEAIRKYDEMTYKLFAHVFTALPLATVISASHPFSFSPTTAPLSTPAHTANSAPAPPILSPEGRKRFFVTHGGLFSRDDVTLEEIRHIPRLGLKIPFEGLMFEMLWTDPQDRLGRGPNCRGSGLVFGPDVTRRWCELNKVTGMFRSHELREDGYSIEHSGLCTTVFSAPNHKDENKNKGAFIRVDASGNLEYIQFDAKPHPPVKIKSDSGA